MGELDPSANKFKAIEQFDSTLGKNAWSYDDFNHVAVEQTDGFDAIKQFDANTSQDNYSPPEYKSTIDKGDSFKDFINRHCGGEENLFQPVNGVSALEFAGLKGAESIGQ